MIPSLRKRPHLCSWIVLVRLVFLREKGECEGGWRWQKSTPSGLFYLLLLFCGASFLSFLFRLFLSSRLLWVLGCGLRLTRFRGWFQREGGFSGGFFFPLALLSLFPLLLFILGGTGRLKKERSPPVISPQSRSDNFVGPHRQQLHHQLSVLLILVFVLLLDFLQLVLKRWKRRTEGSDHIRFKNKASGLWLGTRWPSYRSQNLLLPSVLSSVAAGSPLLQLWTPGCSLIL